MSMTAGVAAYRDENSSEGQDDCCSSGQLCQTKVPWYRPRESFVLKGTFGESLSTNARSNQHHESKAIIILSQYSR